MANTYTQIHLHLVFAVQNRLSLIHKSWKDQLYKYIAVIIQNNGHKLLAINGIPDHLHVLIGYRPSQSLPQLMQDIKGDSSKRINNQKLVKGKFSWQKGYVAYSNSKSQIKNVIEYILNQEKHHSKNSFTDENIELLKKFEVDFNHNYIFKESN